MNRLPEHGRISCRACWAGYDGELKRHLDNKRFCLVNDPGAWGSPEPVILVLGQTKGNTQSDELRRAVERDEFDKAAFAGFRPNLVSVLHAVGAFENVASINPFLTEREPNYGWGSVIRCSLTGWDNKKLCYSAESGKVLPAYTAIEAKEVVSRCMNVWLRELPARTRLIILLGNSNDYIKKFRDKLIRIHPDLIPHPRAPHVAHFAAKRSWVHVGHPSKGNGYLSQFLNGAGNAGQGKKREDAKAAVAFALDGISLK